jgi:hypothetical protein
MDRQFVDRQQRVWSIVHVPTECGGYLRLTPPWGGTVELQQQTAAVVAELAGQDQLPPPYEDVVQPEIIEAFDDPTMPGAIPTVEIEPHSDITVRSVLLVDDEAHDDITVVDEAISRALADKSRSI